MASLLGQDLIDLESMGAIALPNEINHIYGTTAKKLVSPDGARALVVMADKGGWRIRTGDFESSGMPATELPAAAVTDGSGGWYIPELQAYVLPAAVVFTFKGYAANSVLSYGWL